MKEFIRYNLRYAVMVLLMLVGNFCNAMVTGGQGWAVGLGGSSVSVVLWHVISETWYQVEQKRAAKK